VIQVLLALLGILILGVERAGVDGQQPALAATHGTVYFIFHGYEMPPGMFGTLPSISILVDGQRVATPKQRTYFGISVPPGRHTFASKALRTNPRETAIDFDIAAGQQRFVRIDVVIAGLGIVKWTPYLRIVDDEEGRASVAALRPLEAKHIHDKGRVTVEGPHRQTVDLATNGSPPPLPDEQGVFAVVGGQLRKLPGEMTDLRETSVHGLTASVKNARSGARLTAPLEFVIRCSADTTAAEYVFLQLFTRRDRREFRTLDGGKSAMRQGPERMSVPFQARRIAQHVYHVSVAAVPKGEFGFVPPGGALRGSANLRSVIYTFGVD
jgi:hypothetical protein